jgi:hypothetical protein
VTEGAGTANNPTAKGGRPKGTAAASPAVSTARPSSGSYSWTPKAAGKDPWSRGGGETPWSSGGRGWGRGGDSNNEDEERRPSSSSRGGGSADRGGSRSGRGSSEDEDPEERKRFRSGISFQGNVQEPKENQPVKRTDGDSAPITARIVATWKAPVGGGKPGRRYTETSNRRYVTPHVVRVRPWVGSKKRSVEELVEEIPNHQPTQDQIDKYIKAQEEGQFCCTNAAWFD